MSSIAPKPKNKTYKLDIFEVLAALDRKDYDFLSRQSDEAAKAFAPVVAIRWMSATQGPLAEYYLRRTNEVANRQFLDLYEYPDLQFRLLATCGSGTAQRHVWIPMAKDGRTGAKIQTFVGQYFPLASFQEIDILVDQFTIETFIEFVNDTGVPPKDAKEIIDAFKKSKK